MQQMMMQQMLQQMMLQGMTEDLLATYGAWALHPHKVQMMLKLFAFTWLRQWYIPFLIWTRRCSSPLPSLGPDGAEAPIPRWWWILSIWPSRSVDNETSAPSCSPFFLSWKSLYFGPFLQPRHKHPGPFLQPFLKCKSLYLGPFLQP